MFHFELFSSSIAQGAQAFAQVNYYTPNAVLPGIVNGVQVSPIFSSLAWVAGVSANLVHVRPQANSMLPYPYPTLSPNNRGASFESPPRVWDFFTRPLWLKPTEELDVFATQNGAAAQTVYAGAQFSDGKPLPIGADINPVGASQNPTTPGRLFSVHWTAATVLTAGAWTQVTPAFDQALYAGYYALVGARCFSATGLFFRLLPSYGPLWRPGGIMVNSYDQLDAWNQRAWQPFGTPATMNTWGAWLYFYQNVPPNVQIFATAADTAEEGWFDLVYLSPIVIQQTP